MDGVLADVETHFIDWYERDYGVKVLREDLLGKPESEGFPDKTAVRKFVNTPGFFRTVPLMKDAVAAVKHLMEEYEVYIVSAAMEFPAIATRKAGMAERIFSIYQLEEYSFLRGQKHHPYRLHD